MSAKTKVHTTFGKAVEVDERELEDLQRQGLIAPKPKGKGAAPAAPETAEAPAAADTERGA